MNSIYCPIYLVFIIFLQLIVPLGFLRVSPSFLNFLMHLILFFLEFWSDCCNISASDSVWYPVFYIQRWQFSVFIFFQCVTSCFPIGYTLLWDALRDWSIAPSSSEFKEVVEDEPLSGQLQAPQTIFNWMCMLSLQDQL